MQVKVLPFRPFYDICLLDSCSPAIYGNGMYMDPIDSFSSFYCSRYLVITPAVLSGLAWLANKFFRCRYSIRLRLFTMPMCICIALLTAGPILFYIVFASPCITSNDALSGWYFLAATAFATIFVSLGNTKLPASLQVLTIAVQLLILADVLWIGLFPIVALDLIGSGIQMSGGARTCFNP